MARGLSNVLAEAMLISLLLASLSFVGVWHAKLIEPSRGESPILRIAACTNGVAVLAVDSPGVLKVGGDVLAVRVLRANGTVEEIPTHNPVVVLRKGEVAVLALYGRRGVVSLTSYLLTFDFEPEKESCTLVRVQRN